MIVEMMAAVSTIIATGMGLGTLFGKIIRKRKKKVPHPPDGVEDEEASISQSLQDTPKYIQEQYLRDIVRLGKFFAQSDRTLSRFII